MQRNIKLLLEYDGTSFYGWQQQVGLPSVQETLAKAIEQCTGAWPTLSVAGRTDAGVHARAQVVNFKTESTIAAFQFSRAINRYLPPTVAVHESTEVPLQFDARYDSVSKRYQYRVYQGLNRSPLEHNRAWYLPAALLEVPAMQHAATVLVGEHNFEAFRSSQCDAEHAIRRMYNIDIQTQPCGPIGPITTITFHANAFCRHMCRILAGSLIEVGLHKKTQQQLQQALHEQQRASAGPTAPACGLTLLEVLYG